MKSEKMMRMDGDEKDPLFSNIVDTILKGLIFVLPAVILVALFYFLLSLIVQVLTPISLLLSNGNQPTWVLHFVSFTLLVLMLYGAGLLLSNRVSNIHVRRLERKVFHRLPFYASIKDTVQRFTGQKDMPFKYVVLVDIYGSGTKMTGFVTQNVKGVYFTVFVPTAPNPMNGNIYHVPRKLVTFIDIRPDMAMKTIIGLGTGSNELFRNRRQNPYPEEGFDLKFENED